MTTAATRRNVRMTWVDADCPPIFEWTRDETDGRQVFATFTEAKARALMTLRDAKQRVGEAIASTAAMTRGDVSE